MNLFYEAQEIISSEASKPLDRQAHLERFAFLLSAGRNNSETILLATKDAEELASFFSKRFLNDNCKSCFTISSLLIIYHTIQCTNFPLFPTSYSHPFQLPPRRHHRAYLRVHCLCAARMGETSSQTIARTHS